MQIKPFFLDLTKDEKEDMKNELGNILDSGQLILGKNTELFENEFAKYCGSKHAISVNTGTTALRFCVF